MDQKGKKNNIFIQFFLGKHNNIIDRSRMLQSAKEYLNRSKTSSMKSLYKRFSSSKTDEKRLKCLREMFNLYHSLSIPKIEDEIIEEKRLADFVFRYYRNRFVEEIKSDNTILLHEAFQLLHLVYENPGDIDIHKRWITLIVASTQLGKTFLMFALANIFLSLGYCPVFIVKDIFQKNQFLSRKSDDSKELQDFLKTNHISKDNSIFKFSEENINLFNEPLYQDSTCTSQIAASIDNNIEAALNGTCRRIIVCIWNATHIKRIYNNIQPNSNIVLFVDEAHKLGAYKRVTPDTKDQDTENTGNIECKYDNIYLQVKVHARKIFLFTATPQTIIATEPELYIGSIVMMPEGVNYRGIETWDFTTIPEHKDEVYLERSCIIKSKGYKKGIIAYIPCSFITIISSLSDKPMINRINKFGINNYHPINVMAKFEVTNDGHRAIIDCFKPRPNALNEDHQKIIDGKWVVMTINQEGILLYHCSLVGKHINIRDEKYICDDTGECLFPKSVAIGDIWHWLWLNDINKFGRMISIGYKSVEEGLTFCSSWGNSMYTDGNIHLTHFYSHVGNNISAASLEQSTGRLNGNHGDKMSQPPIVYCPLSEKEKLLKSVNLHRKMIKDICNMKLLYNDDRCIDHIHGYEVFSNLVPNKYYGEIRGAVKSLKKKPNTLSTIENNAFIGHTKAYDIMAIINPDLDGGKTRMLEIEFHNEINKAVRKMDIEDTTDVKECSNDSPIAWEKLKKCYKKGGKLTNIINAFVNNELQSMSCSELSNVCNGKFQYENYDHWDIGRHAKYFIITKTKKGYWNIRPEVIEQLNLYS